MIMHAAPQRKVDVLLLPTMIFYNNSLFVKIYGLAGAIAIARRLAEL